MPQGDSFEEQKVHVDHFCKLLGEYQGIFDEENESIETIKNLTENKGIDSDLQGAASLSDLFMKHEQTVRRLLAEMVEAKKKMEAIVPDPSNAEIYESALKGMHCLCRSMNEHLNALDILSVIKAQDNTLVLDLDSLPILGHIFTETLDNMTAAVEEDKQKDLESFEKREKQFKEETDMNLESAVGWYLSNMIVHEAILPGALAFLEVSITLQNEALKIVGEIVKEG